MPSGGRAQNTGVAGTLLSRGLAPERGVRGEILDKARDMSTT